MNIPRDELKRIIDQDEDVLVIDVLPYDRYLEHHIPGSISVPLSEPGFVPRVERQTIGKEQPIVVYCASASCTASRDAAKALSEAGFTDVRAYEGGIAEWEEAGHPLVSGAAAL
jgi:rhodanese-related sulfurtransferase